MTWSKFKESYTQQHILEHFHHFPSPWQIFCAHSVTPRSLPREPCSYGHLLIFVSTDSQLLLSHQFSSSPIQSSHHRERGLSKTEIQSSHFPAEDRMQSDPLKWCSGPSCSGSCFTSPALAISQACHASHTSVPLHMSLPSPEMPFSSTPGQPAQASYLLPELPQPPQVVMSRSHSSSWISLVS